MDSLAKTVRFSAVTVSEAAHVIQSMGRVLPDVNQGGLVKLATKVTLHSYNQKKISASLTLAYLLLLLLFSFVLNLYINVFGNTTL